MRARPARRSIFAAIMWCAIAGCSSVNPYFDPNLPHRARDGFRNNHETPREGGYWKWQWERWRDGLPKPPDNAYRFPMAPPETAWLRANRTEPSVTWIGHATLLIQIGGRNILTDPHLEDRASPLSFAGPQRRVRPGLDYSQLPHIDAVVISHSHYDHLDLGTVRKLAAQAGGSPRFHVPLGLAPWFRKQGIAEVVELDWWQAIELGGLKIHCVPVHHWSARTPFDRNETLWGGWVVEHPSFRFFFSGDTGYSPDFRDIGARFGGFDLAAIPIGAYEPRWFMSAYHVNPVEAVRIHGDLRARQSVGIHWGTFELTDEPLDEPPRALERALKAQGLGAGNFFVLRHGETRRLAPAAAR